MVDLVVGSSTTNESEGRAGVREPGQGLKPSVRGASVESLAKIGQLRRFQSDLICLER